MKIPHLLAVATSISLSVTALAQFPVSTASAKRVPHATRTTQTGAMLPVPASAASDAASAARPDAPKLSGVTGKHHAPLTRRQHLARYRDRNSGAASGAAGDPYQYDGWSASSAYANPAPTSP